MKNIAKKTSLSKEAVSKIIIGFQKPISKEIRDEKLIKSIIDSINKIAAINGITKPVGQLVIESCVELIIEHYRFLGLDELTHAYMLANSGAFEVDARMFGALNLECIGRVLKQYCLFRSKIIQEYNNSYNAILDAQKEEEERKCKRKEYDNNFSNMIAKKRQKYVGKGWENAPAYWYKTAERLKLISFEIGERQSIYQRALKLSQREIAQKNEDQSIFQQLLSAIEAASNEANLTSKAKTIAQKIAVYEKLIMQDINTINNE